MTAFIRTLKWMLAAAVLTLAATVPVDSAFAATSPNLIANPGAEAGAGSPSGGVVPVPDWTEISSSTFTAVKYGAQGFPTKTSPGPTSRGKNFFAGGPDGTDSATVVQTIKLSAYVTAIKAGHATFHVQAWLGGVNSQNDSGFVEVDWKNGQGDLVGESATLGPVTAAQRGDVTELIKQTAAGKVPKGARSVFVQLSMLPSGGSYNFGLADNLSLTITTP